MTNERKRVHTTKPSRNGCRTCKTRRIKCDETWPSCVRCVKSGWKCDGYSARTPPSDISATHRPLLPARPSAPTIRLALAQAPSGTTNVERCAFDFFRRDTARSLEVISPTKEWVRVALQMALQAEPVFYAITAVGSAHNANTFILDTSLTRHVVPRDQTVATNQYCKAMTSLQQYIKQAMSGSAMVEPILIACVLFICFEVTENRTETAISHLNIGRRIIADFVTSQSASMQKRSPSQQVIWQMAEAFDTMLDAGGLMPHSRKASYAFLETESLVPWEERDLLRSFSTTEEAKASLDALTQASVDVREELLRLAEERVVAQYGRSMFHGTRTILALCFSKTMDLSAAPQLQSRIHRLKQDHMKWLTALTAIQKTSEPGHSKALIAMQIRHFTSMFTVSTCRDREECLVDRFEADFVRVLDLCDEFFSSFDTSSPLQRRIHPDWPSPETQAHGFSVEPCILPALYLICCKCRDSMIRWRAAKLLLNRDRREGLFWSGVMAAFGEAHIGIEERRARALLSKGSTEVDESKPLIAEQVAEAARFADAVVAGDDGPPPRTTVWTGRLLESREGDVEVVVYKACGVPMVLEEASRTVYNIAH